MLDSTIKEYVLSKLKTQQPDDSECRKWLIELSEKASQRKFVTHAPKFIHPDIKDFSNISVEADRENDGYIRTGNVRPYYDAIGNAAALPASELMSLKIQGRPLYEHLKENTDVAEEFIAFIGKDGSKVRDNFMKMFSDGDISSTDSRARQVFFPVGNDEYHIITPLMSSPVMNQLSETLEENRTYNNNPTGSDAKNPPKARDFESDGKYLEGGYWTLSDTVNINYGGTKPQNISSFNSRVKTLKLLKSVPPQIRRRKIRIPVTSFFSDSVYAKADRYSYVLTALDRIFKTARNNEGIRDKRDEYYYSLLEEIATDIAAVRNEINLFEGEYRGSLDSAEYMMLYEDEKRFEDDEWLRTISEKFARWFFTVYSRIVAEPVTFGDAEYRHVRDYAFENKEVFIQ